MTRIDRLPAIARGLHATSALPEALTGAPFVPTVLGSAHGYRCEAYARSLAAVGSPLFLTRADGWLLDRPVPNSRAHDLSGCYPLLACGDWAGLESDLRALPNDFASIVGVADPLADVSPSLLQQCFPDLMRPFKDHMIANLSQPFESYVSSQHQRKARRSLLSIEVEASEEPWNWTADWLSLYSNLVDRHSISGVANFSEKSLVAQLRVPGALGFRALNDGETIGMLVFYLSGPNSYYHLGAHSETGYGLGSSFALFWRALEWMQTKGVERVDLGGGAGLAVSENDGLARFKRGWANEIRPAYLCGRIINPELYHQLSKGKRGNFFPTYRSV